MATWTKVQIGNQQNLGGSDLESSDTTRNFKLAESGAFFIKGNDDVVHLEINRSAAGDSALAQHQFVFGDRSSNPYTNVALMGGGRQNLGVESVGGYFRGKKFLFQGSGSTIPLQDDPYSVRIESNTPAGSAVGPVLHIARINGGSGSNFKHGGIEFQSQDDSQFERTYARIQAGSYSKPDEGYLEFKVKANATGIDGVTEEGSHTEYKQAGKLKLLPDNGLYQLVDKKTSRQKDLQCLRLNDQPLDSLTQRCIVSYPFILPVIEMRDVPSGSNENVIASQFAQNLVGAEMGLYTNVGIPFFGDIGETYVRGVTINGEFTDDSTYTSDAGVKVKVYTGNTADLVYESDGFMEPGVAGNSDFNNCVARTQYSGVTGLDGSTAQGRILGTGNRAFLAVQILVKHLDAGNPLKGVQLRNITGSLLVYHEF